MKIRAPRFDLSSMPAYPGPSQINRLIYPGSGATYSSPGSKKKPKVYSPSTLSVPLCYPNSQGSLVRLVPSHSSPHHFCKEWSWPLSLARSQLMTQPSTGFPSSRHSVQSATEFDHSSRSLLLPDPPHNLLTTPCARRLGHGCGLVWATECTPHAGTKLYVFSSAARFIN
jgi:hypothetical protein